jgi:hypothetical protein
LGLYLARTAKLGAARNPIASVTAAVPRRAALATIPI